MVQVDGRVRWSTTICFSKSGVTFQDFISNTHKGPASEEKSFSIITPLMIKTDQNSSITNLPLKQHLIAW